ncbi:DUF488 domain-containing protein [candidate division KSB1 bacterium]|nr:DUF488 domain-containing protein [candidate division KSB1 bacterium]
MEIFTLGHSNRTLEAFLELLKINHIRLVADVRRYPLSPKFPQYNGSNLQQALFKHEIAYHWFGNHLGGFRTEGYENYMKTESYKAGIEQLIEMSQKLKTVILCAEKAVTRCHRLHLSDSLMEAELRVVHIVDKQTQIDHGTLSRDLRTNRGDIPQMELRF